MNRILIAGLKRAHKTVRALNSSPLQSAAAVARGEAPDSTYLRRLCCLAFLAPDIQEAILQGRQPRGLTLQSILTTPVAASWAEQRRQLGFQLAAASSTDL